MSNNVDKRVVQMEFDNAQFERRVKTTRESLSKLKTDLKFDENVKSLSNLKEATKGFSFDGMTSGLETVNAKFSALSAVGFTVIQNLTNGVINFGKKIASSTFGQMLSGGKTRALNLEQAQFQIQGLGVDWKSTANEFGVALYDQIDKAVSGTAYGLDAAAKVAGQLLASNVKEGSQEMQNALSGISGVAAMTNSTYEDIGDIFTTVAGNGKLMTEQLRQFSSRGLNAAATLAKSLNKSEAEIRDMVSKGEIDFDTFAKAMNEAFGEQATKANETYSGSLSNVKAALSRIGAEIQTPLLDNMRQTFVALIPVLNSLKTALAPVFETAAKAMEFFRKEIVKTLSKFAVFDEKGKTVSKGMNSFAEAVKKAFGIFRIKSFIENLKKAYASTKKIFSGIGKLISAIIVPFTKGLKDSAFGKANPIVSFAETAANALSKLAAFINNFAEKVKNAVNENNALFRIAKGIGAAFKIAFTLIKSVFSIFGGVAKASSPVVKWLLQIAAALGDFVVKMQKAIEKSGVFKGVMQTIGSVFGAIGKVFSAVGTRIAYGMKAIQDGFNGVDGSLISKLTNILKAFVGVIREFVERLSDALFSKAGQNATSILDKLTSGGLIAAFLLLKKQLKQSNGLLGSLTQSVKKIANDFSGIVSNIKTIFGTIGDTMQSFNKKVKTEAFLNIAKGMLILVAALFILSTIDSDALYSSIIVMGLLFGEIALFVKKFVKAVGSSKTSQLLGASTSLMILATAVLILAGAVKMLAKLPIENALGGVLAVALLCEVLVAVVKQLSETADKKLAKGLTGLIALALAVRVLSSAVSKLADLSWEGLSKGLVGVAALIAMLIAFIKSVDKGGKIMAAATGMLILAVAMELFVHCVKRLAKLSWEDLAKGVVGLAAIFAMLNHFIKVVSKSKASGVKLLATALAMVVLTAAIEVMVHVCKRLAAMPFDSMIQGLIGLGVIMGEIIAFTRLVGDPSKILRIAAAMVIMGIAIAVFGGVISELAKLPVEGTLAAAAAISILLLSLVAVLKSFSKRDLTPKQLVQQATAIAFYGRALKDIAAALKTVAAISILDIVKSLVTIIILMTALVIATNKINKKKIADLTYVSVAIAALAASVKLLADISILGAILAVTTLIGVFAAMWLGVKMLGKHTKTLDKLTWSMVKFAGSMALMGLSMVAFGAGLLMIGAGLMTIVTAAKEIPGILVPLFTAIRDSAPILVEAIFAILDSILDMIGPFFKKLLNTIKEALFDTIDTIIEMLPKISQFIDVFIDTVGPILVEKIPLAVEIVCDFIIALLDKLIEKVPIIIVKVVQLLDAIFRGFKDAMGQVNPGSIAAIIVGFGALVVLFKMMAQMKSDAKKALVTGLVMVLIFGLLSAIFVLLAQIDTVQFGIMAAGMSSVILSLSVACVLLGNMPISAAAIAVANLAILIAGFIAILLALGGLKQIPGFTWLIGEGIEVLCQLGEGLGRFIGSIIKGIGLAIADMLVGIAQRLSIFAMMIQPFVQAMRRIDLKVLEGAGMIAATILALTAAEFINGVLSFLGGGLDFKKLAEDLVTFGKGMIEFSSTISGKIDTKAVSAAAEAGKMIADMAAAMPNQGGVLGWLMGENSLGVIAPQLVPFGEGLRDFSATVSGKIDNEAVVAACEAGKAIAEMASTLPNEGGVLGWLVGENSLGVIAPQLVPFGEGLRDFSAAVKGKIDVDAVMAAVECAQAIADMSNTLPNQGGIVAWFTGDNKMEDWAPQLKPLGEGLADFSQAIGGDKIDPDAMLAAVECAKGIVELSNHIPNQDGIGSWFAGDNKLSDWAPQLKPLGENLAAFSSAVGGSKFDVEACKAAAEAGAVIAEMSEHVPNEGGVQAWFSGEKSLAHFADALPDLGTGLASFSASVSGKIDAEAVKVAAEAGKTISEMCDHIPAEGGIEAWFAGEKSISKFAKDLPDLAEGLAGFSRALTEDGAFNGTVVKAAAIAGKALAEMCNSIPKEGGIKAWFTGETKFSKWSEELPVFGKGIKDMAGSLSKVTDKDIDKIHLAADAGEALAELCEHIPKHDGVVQWFTGDTKLSEWADELPKFGSAIKDMADALADVTNEDIDKISSVSEVADMLVQMSNNTPKKGGLAQWFGGENVSLSDIGEQLKYFLEYMAEGFQYFNKLNKNWDQKAFELFFDEMVYVLRKISDVKMEEKNLWKTGRDDNLDRVGNELYYFISWMSDAYAEFNKANKNWDPKAFEVFFDEMVYVLRKISTIEIESEKLIKMGTDTNLDKVGHQLYYFISWMSDAYSEFNKANKGFDIKAFEKFFDVSVKIIKGITSVTSSLTDESVESLNKLSKAFPEFVKNLVDLSKKIGKSEVEGVKNASSAYKAIIDVVKSCPKDLSDSFTSVLKELNSIDIQKWLDTSQNINALKKGGQAFIDGFLKGAKDYRRSAITTMKDLFTGTVDGQKGILKALVDEGIKSYTVERTFKSAAENLVNQMKAGFGNKETDLKNKVSSVLSSAESTANSFKQKFIDIGMNFCKGIASGIYNSEYEVINAAYSAAKAAVDTTTNTLKVNSPSRVGIGIGRFWDLGLAKGITTYSSAVSAASGEVSEEVVSLSKSLMDEISKIEDIDDSSMTITPVIDTSEVAMGLSAISEMMNMQKAYAISAEVSATRSRNSSSNEQTIHVETNNDDVVAELRDVKNKMEKLENSLSDLGVYLDGDSLVGGILPRVDRGLGKRAERVRKAGR